VQQAYRVKFDQHLKFTFPSFSNRIHALTDDGCFRPKLTSVLLHRNRTE